MRLFGFKIATAAFAAAMALPAPAPADSMTWHIRSDYPHVVSLEFYSQDRNHAWPGDGQVYVLDDSDTHSYTLSCNNGEDICFGAWVRGNSDKYWGVGRDNAQHCTDCCYYCTNGETDLRILNR
jgi:hypothetical protein